MALEYAHRTLDEVGVAWQLVCEDTAALTAGFDALADQLGARDLLERPGSGGVGVMGCLPNRRPSGCWYSTMPQTRNR